MTRCGLLGAVVLVLGLAFFIVAFVVENPQWGILAAVAAAALALGALMGGVLYARHLNRLRAAIRGAQDGLLDPIAVPGFAVPGLRMLYHDYNRMVVTLGQMFAFVEGCQNRFLGERNRMNAIVQGVPAALLSLDDNHYITTANQQAEALFGPDHGSLPRKNLFDVLMLKDGDRDILRDAFLYKQLVRNWVIHVMLKGSDRWLSVNLSFVSEQEADMTAVMTLLDITDYKHLQESAYNREKLVAMGQLAAGVAHELNTPLGNILGYAQLLAENPEDPATAHKYSHVIREEARRCSRIVHNLLSFARKERCQGDYCDVNALVEEIVETFIVCRLKGRNIQVDMSLDPDGARADEGCGELDIVLTNVLLNAIQALKDVDNPKITIRTEQPPRGRVTIAIEDNGPGVPPELRTRIFEPFFTTKDVGAGSGLGLSISHAMLTRRGGELRYDPSYLEGARFLVTMPASEQEQG